MYKEHYHNGPYTYEVIKQWAYDDNMYLSEQDEDLILRSFDTSVLFEFLIDPNCPKQGLISGVIDDRLRSMVLRNNPRAIQAIKDVIALCQTSEPSMPKWQALLEKKLAFAKGIHNIDRAKALEMGEVLLLNGGSYPGVISITEETLDSWVVERTSSAGSDRLLIKKTTGHFTYQMKVGNGYYER